MKCHVLFSPEAMEQLADLYQYIAFEASPEIALGYTEAIVGIFYGGQDYESRLSEESGDDSPN